MIETKAASSIQKKNITFKMTISGREDTIRLGRDVVLGLGEPEYIKILVSDTYNELVFTRCSDKEPMAFKVPKVTNSYNYRMRMYSKEFVHDVLRRNRLMEMESYVFKGRYLNEQNSAIVFSLETAENNSLLRDTE